MYNSTNHALRTGLHVKLVSLFFLTVLLTSCHRGNKKEDNAAAYPVNGMDVTMILKRA